MVPLPLLATLAIVATFAWGWFNNWLTPKSQPMDKARMEQELKKTGAMDDNGTVSVDKEFDTELNAIIREINSIESDDGAELDEIEKLP